MIYFKFELEESTINSKNKIKKNPLKVLFSTVLSFLPKANPRFENQIQDVKYWFIEYNEIENYVEREVGISDKNKVILKMPYDEDYGYWSDSHLKIEDFERLFDLSSINKIEFEQKWNELA